MKNTPNIWLAAGVIHLAILLAMVSNAARAEDVGFGLYLGNATSSVLKGEKVCNAIRFTADRDMAVDTLQVQTSAPGQGKLRLMLCEDDGFGSPTMDSPMASGELATSAGWLSVGVEPVQVRAGGVYYLVVQPVGDSVILVRTLLASKADIQVRDGSADAERAVLTSRDGGRSWPTVGTFGDRAQVFGICNSRTGDAIGQPYSGATLRQLGSNIYQGQRFVFQGDQQRTLEAITIRLRSNPQAQEHGPVDVHLVDAASREVMWSASAGDVSGVQPDDVQAFRAAAEGVTATLEPGKAYVVAVTSEQSQARNAWRLDSVAASRAGSLLGGSYQGDEGYSVHGSWKADKPVDINDSTGEEHRFDSYFMLHLKD